jgi:hypothetical protein
MRPRGTQPAPVRDERLNKTRTANTDQRGIYLNCALELDSLPPGKRLYSDTVCQVAPQGGRVVANENDEVALGGNRPATCGSPLSRPNSMPIEFAISHM